MFYVYVLKQLFRDKVWFILVNTGWQPCLAGQTFNKCQP